VLTKRTITCFVICPIGPKGSETRKRSDKVLRFIISPIADKVGLHLIRADQIPSPGIITDQIMKHLLEDELVIADLTDSNANVFYELAIRHVARKPVIQLIQEGEKIPFDAATMRTIEYSFDVERINATKEELENQISSVLHEPLQVATPFSISSDLRLYPDLEKVGRLEDPGNKVVVFFNRHSTVDYFVEMYDKATKGDTIWAQGIGHTAYPKNLKQHLSRLASKGVTLEVIVNSHSSTASEFKDLLSSISTARFVERADNAIRVQGLSEKEAIIALPTPKSYTSIVVRDHYLVAVLRDWFVARFTSKI